MGVPPLQPPGRGPMRVTALAARVAAELAHAAPGRLALIAVLSVLRSLSEGLSLALVIPLLALAGTSTDGPQGFYAALVRGVTDVFGRDRAVAVVLGCFLLALLVRALIGFAATRLKTRLVADFTEALRLRVYAACSRASWLHLARMQHGRSVHALTAQADSAGYSAVYIIDMAAAAATILIGIAVAFTISAPMTLAVLAAVALLSLPLLALHRLAFRRGSAQMHSLQGLHDALQARIGGLKLGKALACEPHLEQQFARNSAGYREAVVRARDLANGSALVYEIGTALLLVALVLASRAIWDLRIAELSALVIIFIRLVPLTNGLVSQVQTLAATLPDYAALMALEAHARSAAEPAAGPVRRMCLRSALELVDVGLQYPEAGDNYALRHVNLRLAAGATVGILGRSGAGKSSLADVMAGLLEPSEGVVRIDGEMLTAGRRQDWRASIAYVPQDAPLFHDTVRRNLQICVPDASDQDIRTCLRAVAAEALVDRLPDGLDTLVGERGARLSGGERQRLRLASVLLRRPELLILDEATSGLNPADEAEIIANLRQLHRMTIVVIAHREASLAWTDRLIVLERGMVVDDGPTREVARRNQRLLVAPPLPPTTGRGR